MSESCDLPPLVLVHGLKGSHLRDPVTGSRRYVDIWQLLRLSDDQIPLPLEREGDNDGKQVNDGLQPDGPIMEIKALGINLASFYGGFVREMEKSRKVLLFSYDWRRELAESGRLLEMFLESVKNEHGGCNGAQVVCHSMGGLITLPVVNRRPDLFHSVLFAAAAIKGAVTFLGDVSDTRVDGNKMGPNKKMMTPRHWLGWTSSAHFWPLVGQPNAEGGPHLVEADGSEVQCDFHNINDWKTLQLGPYHPKSGISEGMNSDAEDFFAGTLARAQAYRRLVVYDSAVNYPPIAVLNSDKYPTVTSWCREGRNKPFNLLEGFTTTAGDGRLTLVDTQPPTGVPVLRTITNQFDHAAVLDDFSSVHALLEDLLGEADRRGQVCGSRKQQR